MTGDDEIAAAVGILSGPMLVHGKATHAFEEAFASRGGARRAVALSSCTAGLHLSLLAHDLGPGDEVLVPAMTHVATAHAVEFCGARPVFVDADAADGNISTDAMAAAYGDAVRAALVVHYLGLPCDMDTILAAANKANAFVVEDCALALDATYDGRKVGNFGVTGCFSFYPVKHLTTIEGGMVITNDDTIGDRIAQCRAFGYDRSLGNRARPGIYDVTALGYNYRMNEVEAAIGLVQLDRLDGFQAARRRNFALLYEMLREMDEFVVFPAERGKAISSHYCLNAVLTKESGIDRDDVVDRLRLMGVGSSVHYPAAVPMFTYYREKYGFRQGQFPVAEWLAANTISLPVGPHLTEEDSEHIGACLKQVMHDITKNRGT